MSIRNEALSGKNFSAFCSACGKNLSSVCCAHSLSESVYLGTLLVLRLKCHFHLSKSSIYKCNCFLRTSKFLTKCPKIKDPRRFLVSSSGRKHETSFKRSKLDYIKLLFSSQGFFIQALKRTVFFGLEKPEGVNIFPVFDKLSTMSVKKSTTQTLPSVDDLNVNKLFTFFPLFGDNF